MYLSVQPIGSTQDELEFEMGEENAWFERVQGSQVKEPVNPFNHSKSRTRAGGAIAQDDCLVMSFR